MEETSATGADTNEFLVKLTVDDRIGVYDSIKDALLYTLQEVLKVNGYEETSVKIEENSLYICKSNEVKGLFKEDKDPAPVHTQLNLEYSLTSNKISENGDIQEKQFSTQSSSCFNCNGSHNLKDCTLPRDNKKINKARASIGKRNDRYHEVIEQKFGRLIPGTLSNNLRRALGLSQRSVPPFIYRMRHSGYPMAWLKEAEVVASQLKIIEKETPLAQSSSKKKIFYDLSKIHDFPGFNVPLLPEQIDEHWKFNAPPMLPIHEKISFIRNLNGDVHVEEQSEEDMDIQPESPNSRSESPTLVQLRETQMKLLNELNSDDSDKKCFDESKDADTIESPQNFNNRSNALSTAEGTPVIQAISSFNSLPAGNNFSVGVSDVIHFENLPDSTGQYEKMRKVLSTVRKTLAEKFE